MHRLSVGLFALALSSGVAAADFGSVATSGAILYDAPSLRAHRIALAPLGMPVELLALSDPWIKVRDLTGQSFWIERGDLSKQRMLIATMTATVRIAPQALAEPVLRVERGVLLELVEQLPQAEWARVRHRGGLSGFVRTAEVWGL